MKPYASALIIFVSGALAGGIGVAGAIGCVLGILRVTWRFGWN